MPLFDLIIQKTLRVPTLQNGSGEASVLARQLDAALLSVGFTLSKDLYAHYASSAPGYVVASGQHVLAAVRALVGDDVKHNVYFIDFPDNVPDTFAFWWQEMARVYTTGQTQYGRYQHSYEEMLSRRNDYLAAPGDRVTVLHLGTSLEDEALSLYRQLVASTVPLASSDRELVKLLAETCLDAQQDTVIALRETRALVNAVRLRHGRPIFVSTLTDILRAACALSDGDETLATATRFRSFPRRVRRQLMDDIDTLASRDRFAAEDVVPYQEQWKRLAERLHPHEYERHTSARDVFAVARGEERVRTLASKIETAFASGNTTRAVALLSHKPGLLVRSADRVLRAGGAEALFVALSDALPQVSGRVLLSLREHVQNRQSGQTARLFANSHGRAYATVDSRPPLADASPFLNLLDTELQRRLPTLSHLVVEREMLGVALPLSEKASAAGLHVLPRGSVQTVGEVNGGILRLFVYWKQKSQRTDYDLSVTLLDARFKMVGQVSWTNYHDDDKSIVHSGDLTDAKDGATEFIDIDLSAATAAYIIPQVFIYAGEDFADVDRCFFGAMQRERRQNGKPFEARSVRHVSDLRGAGRVAVPLVCYARGGHWYAKWLHLYQKGQPRFNRVESTHVGTALLARMVVERDYLTVDYLADLLSITASAYTLYDPATHYDHPVTFLGLSVPDGLPEGSKVYTPETLKALLPD